MEKKYKIWYQISTVFDNLPGNKEAITERINNVVGPEFEVIPHGVNYGTNSVEYLYIEFLNNSQFVENCVQAEKEGYDAVVYGCFSDPVLPEVREVLNIPVIGLQQTAAMWTKIYGEKAAIVTYSPILRYKRFYENVNKYGFQDIFNPTVTFDVPLDALSGALKDPSRIMEEFDKACHRAVEAGADVILPGCGLLNILSQRENYTRVGSTGALVLDATSCAIKTAEAAVYLHKNCNMMTSRSGMYASPSKDVLDAARKVYLGK